MEVYSQSALGVGRLQGAALVAVRILIVESKLPQYSYGRPQGPHPAAVGLTRIVFIANGHKGHTPCKWISRYSSFASY